MREVLNCPNCGAPIAGSKCEYCGSVFYDWATISMDKPTFIRMNLHGKLVMFKAVMVDLETNEQYSSYYADNQRITVSVQRDLEIRPVFRVVPHDGPYGKNTWVVMEKLQK